MTMRVQRRTLGFELWLASCLLVAFALGASRPAAGAPLSLCDYTPSQSQFIDLSTTVDLRSLNPPGQDNTLYNGAFKLNGVYLMDTQSRGVTLNGNLKFDFSDPSLNTLNVAPNFKYFPGDNDFFVFLGSDVSNLGALSLKKINLSGLTGYGYGRFRDVTPFSRVLNIQNQLLRLNKLREPLPDETLAHLASLIAALLPGDPLGELIGKIQSVLRQSGLIVGGPLAAPSLLAIERILQDKGSSKFCGWETSFGVELQSHTQSMLGLWSFQYALAPAPRSQLILNTKWSFSPDVLSSTLGTFFLDAQLVYTYRLSDLINAQGRYTFLRSSTRGNAPLDIQSLNLRLNFKLSSLNLLINFDWSLASGSATWSRLLNIDLGYEIF